MLRRGDLLVLRHESYEVLRHLGSGPSAETYEIRSTLGGRRFAARVLREGIVASADDAAEFREQLRKAAALHHQSVALVYDGGETEDGRSVTIRRHFRSSLAERPAKGRSPSAHDAIRWTLDVLRGLQHLHSKGCAHGAVRPENIMLDPCGRAVLCDPAWLTPGADRAARAGGRYESPDLLLDRVSRGEQDDAQDDLYAAAVVLAECLLGRAPFAASAARPIVNAKLRGFRCEQGELSREQSTFLERALAPHPSDRFASAEEMQDEAEEYYQRALTSRADYPLAWFSLGRLQAREEKYEEAEGSMRRYIELCPGDPWAYYILGTSLANLGKDDEAEFILAKASQLDPDGEAGALARLELQGLKE